MNSLTADVNLQTNGEGREKLVATVKFVLGISTNGALTSSQTKHQNFLQSWMVNAPNTLLTKLYF